MMFGRIVGAVAGGSLFLIQCLTLAQAQVLPVLQLTKSAVSGVETPIAQASGWDAVTCATRLHGEYHTAARPWDDFSGGRGHHNSCKHAALR